MPRRIKMMFLAVCASLVATMGWAVVAFGVVLKAIFGDEQFPKPLFWAVVFISLPVFCVVFYRYFAKHEW